MWSPLLKPPVGQNQNQNQGLKQPSEVSGGLRSRLGPRQDLFWDQFLGFSFHVDP